MHLDIFLPSQVEQGALRTEDCGTDKVPVDGGGSVRNNRWDGPLRTFEISFPTAKRDDPIYLEVRDVWRQSGGNLHTFNFRDWTDQTGATVLRVRFDTPLKITGIDRRHDHIDTMTLVEEPE